MARHRFSSRPARHSLPSVDELSLLPRFEQEFESDFEPDLDEITVARLLSGLGGATTEDERRLAAFLRLANGPASAAELSSGPSAEILQVLGESARHSASVKGVRRHPLRHGLVAAVAVGALGAGGVAAAYTGTLRGPVAQLAHNLGAPSGRDREVTHAAGQHPAVAVTGPAKVKTPAGSLAPVSHSATPLSPPPSPVSPPSSASPAPRKTPVKHVPAKPAICGRYQKAVAAGGKLAIASIKKSLIKAAGGSDRVAAFCGWPRKSAPATSVTTPKLQSRKHTPTPTPGPAASTTPSASSLRTRGGLIGGSPPAVAD